MSALRDAFDAARMLMLNAQAIYDRVDVGALPAEDSLCAAISAGVNENEDLSYHGDLNLDVVLNAKHRLQISAMDALADIHCTLSRMTELPIGEGWQLLSISTSSAPGFIEFDGDQYLYGSGLQILMYIE